MKTYGPNVRVDALVSEQVHGSEYDLTCAPAVKYTLICLLRATVSIQFLELHEMDVVVSFLHGDTDVEVYMYPSGGLRDHAAPTIVCKLTIALYGLKHEPSLWYENIDTFLISWMKFIRRQGDPASTANIPPAWSSSSPSTLTMS